MSKTTSGQARGHRLVIPDIWMAELGSSQVQGLPGQFSKTEYKQNTKTFQIMLNSRMLSQHALAPRFKLKHKKKEKKKKRHQKEILFSRDRRDGYSD